MLTPNALPEKFPGDRDRSSAGISVKEQRLLEYPGCHRWARRDVQTLLNESIVSHNSAVPRTRI